MMEDLRLSDIIHGSPNKPVPAEVKTDAGNKFDGDKLRFDLVSPHFEAELAAVMTYGAKKYGERNWEKGISISRYYGALRRHLLYWVNGEEVDVESGLHHLAHATACLMMMKETARLRPEKDDRSELAGAGSSKQLPMQEQVSLALKEMRLTVDGVNAGANVPTTENAP